MKLELWMHLSLLIKIAKSDMISHPTWPPFVTNFGFLKFIDRFS